ncbi:MAG: GNAT family N-acetyltransferase [Elstera sp.]
MSQGRKNPSADEKISSLDLQIRRGELRDFAILAELYLRTRRSAFSWLPPETFQLEDFYRDTQGELIWLAEDGRAVLGFASVYVQSAFLHALYIADHAQGRGVGRALLSHVIDSTPGRMTLKCLTFNHLAQTFYAGRGWRVIGSGDSPHGPYLTFEAPEKAG